MSQRHLRSLALASLFLALGALSGCLRLQSQDDAFVFGPLKLGIPMAVVQQTFGHRLQPVPPSKQQNFQLPPLHLAGVIEDYLVGTTPYEVYFVADQGKTLRKIIMLTKSDKPLAQEAAQLSELLRKKYGQPAGQGEPVAPQGVAMQQSLWKLKDLHVTMADVVRDKTGHSTPLRPDAAGRPGNNPHPRDIDYSLFVMYEQPAS